MAVPPTSLYGLLASRAPREEGALFLAPESGKAVAYVDLDAACARFQGALEAAGAAPGDRVLVQAEKSPEGVLLYLACLRGGFVYVPLNTAYTPAEVAYFLADAAPSVFVCDPKRREALAPAAAEAGVATCLTLDDEGGGSLAEARQAAASPEAVPRAAEDLAAILYTSGTTGRSKGAMLSQGNLASNALALHELWGFEPGDVLLHTLPIFHAHGLFVALHTAMLNGSRILFERSFDAARVVERLAEATVYMGVPTHYTRLLERPELDTGRCRGVRLFVSGSAPLLASTWRAFEARTGHRILERYGMTEAGMITSNPGRPASGREPGSVGFALPEVELRVVDGAGAPLSSGEEGALEIRGPNVCSGYWRKPDKTAEDFRADGFFATGDLARIDATGRVTLIGRAKDLVISGGLNVYPVEVEEAIDALPGVAESAVIGLPHADFGEGVTAVVVRDGAGQTLDEAELLAGLDGRLARFKQPKRVLFVDALPRNAMGKVQKQLLRERYASVYEA